MSAHNSSWWIIYTRIPKIIELYDYPILNLQDAEGYQPT